MAIPVNGSKHLIPAYYSIYRPRKDERLSWPSWLTYSGWLTHISGHPSAAGRAQDRESSPARDQHSLTWLNIAGISMRKVFESPWVPSAPNATTLQQMHFCSALSSHTFFKLMLFAIVLCRSSPSNDGWRHCSSAACLISDSLFLTHMTLSLVVFFLLLSAVDIFLTPWYYNNICL